MPSGATRPRVLVGDFLFSRAFQVMVEDGSLAVLAILSGASAVIAEGEVLQLTTANDTETSEQAYLEVIRAKTAALFAAACRVGAAVAERPKAEEDALEDLRPQSGHRVPARRRRARLCVATAADDGQGTSATISATARSRCPSCCRSCAGTRASASSGAARWRSSNRTTAISPARANSCANTMRSPTRSSARATTGASPRIRSAYSRTARKSARSSIWSISPSNARMTSGATPPRIAHVPLRS